ncbi:hypothetical protein C0Q70_09893 [Pomacea canaliculata]|uniref:Uncharacterized protein n=1 Tax=Pomacea canaliculata TaxID=400727 RepID=A0A2T7PB21_POMCA|nr:hypothetical protein C0Q70_09893 [Pomacea canaliculata]
MSYGGCNPLTDLCPAYRHGDSRCGNQVIGLTGLCPDRSDATQQRLPRLHVGHQHVQRRRGVLRNHGANTDDHNHGANTNDHNNGANTNDHHGTNCRHCDGTNHRWTFDSQ